MRYIKDNIICDCVFPEFHLRRLLTLPSYIIVRKNCVPGKQLPFSVFFSPSILSSVLHVFRVHRSQDRVYKKEDSVRPALDTESLWIGQRLLMNVVFVPCWYRPTTKPLCLKLSSGKPKPLLPQDKYRKFTIILCVRVCVQFLQLYLQKTDVVTHCAPFWGQEEIGLSQEKSMMHDSTNQQTQKHISTAYRK